MDQVENPMNSPVDAGNHVPTALEVDVNSRTSKSSICDDPEIDKILNVEGGLKNFDGSMLPREAEIPGSIANLTNSIVGGGILGLPYAFSGCGWILGTVLIMIAGIATAFSLHLLTVCSLKVPPPASFYKVAHAAIPQWSFLVDFAVFLDTFGIAIAYIIVIGNLMPDVASYIGASGALVDPYVWKTVGLVIVGPISCLKTMDALKYTSAFAIFCVGFIALLIFVYAADPNLKRCTDDSDDCVGKYVFAQFNTETFKVLGVFINAYTCQMNMFPVVNELINPTLARLSVVSNGSIFTAFVFYLLVATSGYAIYGASVTSDVLVSFPDTPVTTMARVFTCILVLFSFPLLVQPGRTSLLAMVARMDPPGYEISDSEKSKRFWIATFFIVLSAYGIGMATSNLGVVLALIGATAATVITYILPGIAYYRMHPPGSGPEWIRKMAAFYVAFGFFIMVFCVTFIFS